MERIYQKSLIVAIITLMLDFTFHLLFTRPMETLTYFVIKFLLAFFVAAGLFSLKRFIDSPKRQMTITFVAGLIFSTLMSTYYRAWELGEANVPFGSRAPDIIGITRYTPFCLASSGGWLTPHFSLLVR